MINTPVAPAAISPFNKHRTLFTTLTSNIDVTSPLYSSNYPTVAAAYGNGAYKATIEEAIAHASAQSAANAKAGSSGIVYVMGVVAVVRPKAPIEPPTIVERFDK